MGGKMATRKVKKSVHILEIDDEAKRIVRDIEHADIVVGIPSLTTKEPLGTWLKLRNTDLRNTSQT